MLVITIKNLNGLTALMEMESLFVPLLKALCSRVQPVVPGKNFVEFRSSGSGLETIEDNSVHKQACPPAAGVMGEINPLIRASLWTPWRVCVLMAVMNGRTGSCPGCRG